MIVKMIQGLWQRMEKMQEMIAKDIEVKSQEIPRITGKFGPGVQMKQGKG